ncbi:MAG: metallophosphoesterase [Geminicoccaceae bacterium]
MADRLALALPPWAEGVLVVGDVHGQLRLFQAAVDLAEAERRYVLSLGDLVDRGPDNAGCVRLMLDLLGRKAGSFVRGNHDDKLHRTLKGNPTNVDSDLAVTPGAARRGADSKALKRGFCSAFRAAPFVVALGSSVMVHGRSPVPCWRAEPFTPG